MYDYNLIVLSCLATFSVPAILTAYLVFYTLLNQLQVDLQR